MKSVHSPAIARTMLFLVLLSPSLGAEDWTTSNGKVYQNVTVVKAEPDAVTILYRDGGALVPLAYLPAALQARFHYDPARAEAAEDQRARDELESEMALQAEIKELNELKKEMRSAQKAAANAARLKELQERIAAYSYEPAILEPQNHNGILGAPTDSNHHSISEILQGNAVAPAQTNAVTAPTPAESAKSTAISAAISSQVAAGKIRLIGKVRSCVAGGCILESVSAADRYTIVLDPSRPDYQLVSERAPGGTVFLYTYSQLHFENEILDIDAYPVGPYTSLSGETMPGLTTSAAFARAYLKLKENQ